MCWARKACQTIRVTRLAHPIDRQSPRRTRRIHHTIIRIKRIPILTFRTLELRLHTSLTTPQALLSNTVYRHIPVRSFINTSLIYSEIDVAGITGTGAYFGVSSGGVEAVLAVEGGG